MIYSPFYVQAELRESLCTYLETAYRIAHPAVVNERAALLREQGIVSQTPFVETTPRFLAGEHLSKIQHPMIPRELASLAGHGLLNARYPLYRHQQRALEQAWMTDGTPQHVIVTTGTGSGKTESFYLPILADILREALHEPWAPTKGHAVPGEWHARSQSWLHSRRHEQRQAAVRALILYPMNALVNDQLNRLRKALTTEAADQWQVQQLNGNRITFGRYTSQTPEAGTADNDGKRTRWRQYYAGVEQDWATIGHELQRSGGWPRPDSAEMLCRWDMQAAPPDILITNYSMLEYMLVRPIEAAIFEQTRAWLAADRTNHRFTLVLDEAHTYSGARGAEVAFLIRRLFERLNLAPQQLRCIATSASLGESREELEQVKQFAADLFGQPVERFQVVTATTETIPPTSDPQPNEAEAFAAFQTTLDRQDMTEDNVLDAAISALLAGLGRMSTAATAVQRLHEGLSQHPRVQDLRRHTARKATALPEVARQVWPGYDNNLAEQATAGILSAGVLAKPETSDDAQPLLPSRMHLMYRGLPGFWACMNPQCSMIKPAFRSDDRPCGKLYHMPTIWCGCGSRVLELMSCRVCGLLCVGGLPEDNGTQQLWPYVGEQLDVSSINHEAYQVVALEDPNQDAGSDGVWQTGYRSVTTSGVCDANAVGARIVWEQPTKQQEKFNEHQRAPRQCPRCQAGAGAGRYPIEPFLTGTPAAVSVLLEHAFRIQPPREKRETTSVATDVAPRGRFAITRRLASGLTSMKNPNRGRKALAFSDGRQAAARLVGHLNFQRNRDLFRQILIKLLDDHTLKQPGTPLSTAELMSSTIEYCSQHSIDPTFGEEDSYWQRYATNRQDAAKLAEPVVQEYIRREVTDRRISIEALGLARWTPLTVDGEDLRPLLTGHDQVFTGFTGQETVALLGAVLRILVGENIVLPFSGDPRDWHPGLIEMWHKQTVVREKALKDGNSILWSASVNNRLTRYLKAVLEQPGSTGTTVTLSQLMDEIWGALTDLDLLIKPQSVTQPGRGIPLGRLGVLPLQGTVDVCNGCGYLSAESVRHVCLRCQDQTTAQPIDTVNQTQSNYYRRLISYVRNPDSNYGDPFPLRVMEHTAQISREAAAIRERHFKDQFIPLTMPNGQSNDNGERPEQHRVDMLSVTTTMEMGIDIGDLTVVALYNMPPTVANYQQRAGRAGRRSDGVATVLTYAHDRSHDQYYFGNVAQIVSGPVKLPIIPLDNLVIGRRHIHALALQRFFKQHAPGIQSNNLLGAFGTVGETLEPAAGTLIRLQEAIANPVFVSSVIDAAMQILGAHVNRDEVATWIETLPNQIEKSLKGHHNDEEMLEVLINGGLLPRYAFPVDVVPLYRSRPQKYQIEEDVSRGLQIALSEFAPGNELVIDGYEYTVFGLYDHFKGGPYAPSGQFYQCPSCRAVRYCALNENGQVAGGWPLRCDICLEPHDAKYVYNAIRPTGFRTNWREQQQKYRGGKQERAGYATTAQLEMGESVDAGDADLRYENRLWVAVRQNSDLYSINRGADIDPGFWICPICGKGLKSQTESHRSPDSYSKQTCGGKPKQRAVLLHSMRTDVALLGLQLGEGYTGDPRSQSGRAVWLSLGAVLLRAAAVELQIDPSELAVGMRSWQMGGRVRLSGEVYMYDTLPNGAGYARAIAQPERLHAILLRAREISAGCTCNGACYSCLLDYSNQRVHPLLDRRLALSALRFIIDGTLPSLSSAEMDGALKHLQDFAVPGSRLTLNGDGTARLEGTGPTITIRPRHPLEYRPSTGVSAYPSSFDLERRPFWVWQRLTQHGLDAL